MSGLNGQFNPRLQRLERLQKMSGDGLPESSASDAGKVLTVGEDGKATWAEPSGGSSADCNCLYNFAARYEPFNVPDLINGGTRTFTPGVDHVYVPMPDGKSFDISDGAKMLYTDKNPPGYLTTVDNENIMIVSWSSREAGAFSSTDTTDPAFAIVNANLVYIELSGGSSGYIVNPENIVYMEVPGGK